MDVYRSVCILTVLLLYLNTARCMFQYDNGKIYRYSYETSVLLNALDLPRKDSTAQRDAGFYIHLQFDLNCIFQLGNSQLFRIQVTEASVNSGLKPDMRSQLSSLLRYPMYFISTNGLIGYIYVGEGESTFSTNVKKGIISVFQAQRESGQRVEVDTSGECTATYTASDKQITKTRSNCKNLEIAGQFTSPNKIFGVSVAVKSTLVYELRDNIINTLAGTTRVATTLNARTDINAGVLSNQKLALLEAVSGGSTISVANLDEVLPKINQETGYSHIISLLPTTTETQHCTEDCRSPLDVLVKIKKDLVKEKLSTRDSAKAFLKMLRSFRNSGKDSIAETLTSSESYYIVSQLIDVASATQTQAAHRALMDVLNFEDKHAIDHPERFLFTSAYVTHPGEYLLNDILKLIKRSVPNENLMESLVLGAGALVNTYCRNTERCQDEIIQQYKDVVLKKLESCSEEKCKLVYVRSLGNAGLPETTGVLVNYIEDDKSSMMMSTTALYALRRIPTTYFTDEVRSSLLKIFHQTNRRYDTSVRISAMEVLLQTPLSITELRNILLVVTDNQEPEFSTYVLKTLIDKARNDPQLRSSLKDIIDDPKINKYSVLMQKGKSSADTGFLAETDDTNCTYGVYIENAKTGVMKRSSVLVNLLGKSSRQHFLTFGLYAEGLESMMGDDEEGGEEGPEATAGLALTLIDVLLRPVEFFRGTSGLMSAVWNAPSEPISALQGNILLQDHSQKIFLCNGFVIDLQVQGAFSLDLSGSISISLWNRNSQSLVKNSGALVIEETLRVESEVLPSDLTVVAESESAIDFKTNVEFYETPFKMCARMERPAFEFRHTISKRENLKGMRSGYKAKLTRRKHIPSETLFLNKQASEQCNILKPED